MKNLFVLLVLAFAATTGRAQSNAPAVSYDDEKMNISSTETDCIDTINGTAKRYLSLSITNKTDNELSVSFKKNMWYAGNCISCDSDSEEYTAKIQLQPAESVQGTCDDNPNLMVFSRMLELKGVRQLTHVELDDITSISH